MSSSARLLGSAINPGLGRELADFEALRTQLRAIRPVAKTVAVLGLTPGEGRSSVAALLALTVTAWTERRVVVLDTVTVPMGTSTGDFATVHNPAGRTVTALLGGDVSQGRLADLIDPRSGSTVLARSRIRSAATPGAAVPVLSLPPGGPDFAPQLVEQTLSRLRQRADLVVIDTPAGPNAAVLHGVVQHADHFVLVVRGDGDVDRRLQAAAQWLAKAPGPARDRPTTAVVLLRGLASPRWSFDAMPVVTVPRDEGLRRRRVDRLSRHTVIAGLTLAAEALGHPMPPVGVRLTSGARPSGAAEQSIFGRR